MKAKRRALAQRREIVGHTQETLAEFMGVELSTVGRWERGETSPQPWCRPRLAQALTVSLEELDRMLAEGQPVEETPETADEPVEVPEQERVLSAPWSHRGTVEVAVVLRGGDRVRRRGFVFLTGAALTAPAHQWLVHEPEPLISGLAGRRVSTELADRFTAMIGELRAMDDVAGGGTVLPLAEQQFGLVADLLDQASYDESTGRRFHAVLAELGQLCGWCGYDAGRQGLAQRYYIAALRAAREGQPADAVTLIDTAVVGARGRETASLLAQLYSKQAYALATMGDTSRCNAAITKARTEVERLNRNDDPPWLYWVSPAEITAGAGRCLQKLGQIDQAVVMLDEGIALFDEAFVRDRTNYVIHVSDALAQPGPQRDLDAAAERGIVAIDLAESLDSTRGNRRLRDLCLQMEPHATVPAVGDFLNRARDLVQI